MFSKELREQTKPYLRLVDKPEAALPPQEPVLRDPNLKPGPKACYALLRSYVVSGNKCWPSIGRLAKDMNVNEATIWRWLNTLREKKCIDWVSGNSKDTSIYTFCTVEPLQIASDSRQTQDHMSMYDHDRLASDARILPSIASHDGIANDARCSPTDDDLIARLRSLGFSDAHRFFDQVGREAILESITALDTIPEGRVRNPGGYVRSQARQFAAKTLGNSEEELVREPLPEEEPPLVTYPTKGVGPSKAENTGEQQGMATLWGSVLGDIKVQVTRTNYLSWFADTQLVELTDTTVTVVAPSEQARDWLACRAESLIARTLRAATGREIRVQLVVRG